MGNKACLKCDEMNCGPEFIKCAGANRRSSGIISDIERSESEHCSTGLYSNTPEADLPTAAQPSDEFVDEVLWITDGFPTEEDQQQLRSIASEHVCCCRGEECQWYNQGFVQEIIGDYANSGPPKCPKVKELEGGSQCLKKKCKLFERSCHSLERWSESGVKTYCGPNDFFVGEACSKPEFIDDGSYPLPDPKEWIKRHGSTNDASGIIGQMYDDDGNSVS